MKSKPLGVGGGIVVMNPDGTNAHKIISGWNADDLVFDKDGGFYFADYGVVGNLFEVLPVLVEEIKKARG